MKSQKFNFLFRIFFALFLLLGLVFPVQRLARAAATLTIEPITWNIIGLDSNDVNVGPNHFPVGARVCNTGDATATNVTATMVWDSSNAFINYRPGTNSTLSGYTIPATEPDTCVDFYFEVEVTRDSAAYNTTRRYHITVDSDQTDPISTPTPRELFVEHLISQSRNSVIDVQVSPTGASGSYTSIPAGGTMSLVVGNTYWIKLVSPTATNGYEQIESFINFPNTIFQVITVDTTYSAESSATMNPPYDRLYGDACVWENNPYSMNYRSCLDVGKAGGDVTVTYKVTILKVPDSPLTNPEALTSLIYDFSGSSYHYNSDSGSSVRYADILPPSAVTIAKRFSPNPIGLDGVSRMTIRINNPSTTSISSVNFVDDLPDTSQTPPAPGNMVVADTPNLTYTSCGTNPLPSSLSGNPGSISFSNITIPAYGSCIITVDVKTSAVGTYTNTTNHLYINTTDTGNYASAPLTVTNAQTPPGPPTSCANPVQLAQWNFSNYTPSTSTNNGPFNPSAQLTGLTGVQATYGSATGSASGIANNTTYPTGWPKPDAQTPTDTASWGIFAGWPGTGVVPTGSSTPYFQFEAGGVGNYGGVALTSSYNMTGNWSQSDNVYVLYSTNGTSWSQLSSKVWDKSNGWKTGTAGINGYSGNAGDSTVYFRVLFSGAQTNNETATIYLDDVTITGCRRPDPPTVTKSFSPDPVAVGKTSTLTFTITNPNTDAGAVLSGISLSDYLPTETLQGTVAVTNGSPSVVGTGTDFTGQLMAGSIVYIPTTFVDLTGTVAVTQGSQTVTGTGTSFNSQLAVGSILSINSVYYTVSAIASDTSLALARPYRGSTASGLTVSGNFQNTFTVSTITDDTHLTLTGNYTGSTASGLSLGSGLTLASVPTTTCSGSTVTGAIGRRAISLAGNSLTGTVAVTSGSPTVTGTGTSFQSQLAVGSNVYINSILYKVSAIGSNTSLTLSSNYSGATVTGGLTMTTDSTNLTGTVAVTNGSATVTGTGTSFQTQLAVGNVVTIAGVRYGVSAIAASPTQSLTLNRVYAGTTTSGLTMTKVVGLAGGSTCTITASVKANAAGVRTNVSEAISATESGLNTTSSGYATANLTAVLPPVISKSFSPDSVVVGGVSKLVLTITNPNPKNALSGVAFSDNLPTSPGSMVVAAPTDLQGTVSVLQNNPLVSGTSTRFITELDPGSLVNINSVTYIVLSITDDTHLILTTNYTGSTASGLTMSSGASRTGCGTPAFSPVTGAGSISFTGGTLAAGGTCRVTVNVTVPSVGAYLNTSDTVSHIINTVTENGNTTSATLTATAVHPGIAIQKQIGTSSSGSWYPFVNVSPGSNVYYLFTVENTGDVPLTSIGVTDPNVSTSGCSWRDPLPVAVAGNDNHITTCMVGPISASFSSLTNTAYAHGVYGTTTYNSNNDSATYNTTGLTLVKGVTESYFSTAGQVLHYSYVVTNSGSVDLAGPVNVYDDKSTNETCPALSTVGDGDNYLDVGESITCTATYNTTSPDVTAGSVTNSAYATAGGVTSNTDTKTVPQHDEPTPVTMSYFRAQRQGSRVDFEWSTATETANAGFNLYVEDGDLHTRLNAELIPSLVISSLDRQDYTFSADVAGNSFYIEDISVKGDTRLHGPFQLGEPYGERLDNEKIDQAAVGAEHSAKSAEHQNALKRDMKLPAAAFQPASGNQAVMQLSTTLNLKVRKTGIYRVTYEALCDAGLDLAGVPIAKITLANRGQMVPLYVEGSGKFGPGGFIEFYGQALDTIYTDTNVYTLQVSQSPADRIQTTSATPGKGLTPPASYTETLRVNNQRVYASYAPGADAWYDTSMLTFTAPKSWSFSFTLSGLADPSASANLELVVWGLTEWPQNPDHHLVVSLNGAPVANQTFDGLVEQIIKISLPPGVLKEGQNTLQLTLPGDTGLQYDMVNLDRFSLSYPRKFQAQDGRLTFTAAGKAFEVSGLPSVNVVVYRLDEKGPARLERVKSQASGGSYTASFAGSNQAATYVVAASSALYTPEIEVTRLNADLSRPAQYLVISHPDFIAGLQPLVQARQAQGLTVSVVDVTDLYAQYTYGIFDPHAIQQYIAYAAQNLGVQYVLLVGGDTYDYRNYLGRDSLSYIPSLYMDVSSIARFVPVDPLYTDLNGDYTPDLAIGRFPVRTAAELSLMINKTLAYASKNYTRSAVFVSDKNDGIVNFKNNSNRLAAFLPPTWSVENLPIDNLGVSTARQRLIAAMNRGVSLVTYTGHSGATIWSFSNLFNTNHAKALTNAGRPFVVVQWSCWNTYYADPVNNYLVQSFLFSGDKGAAAVLGAVSLAYSDSEEMLGQLLTPRLVTPGMTLGQAMKSAKSELAQSHPDQVNNLLDVLLGWTLMGDPALMVAP
jgi:hypothetical protein